MLCVLLEGWEGGARGRRYGDMCICIADSLCYKAVTNAPLWGNCPPIKMLKKAKKAPKVIRKKKKRKEKCKLW